MTQTGIIYPKLKIADVGHPVRFTCSSKSLVMWHKNGWRLPDRYSVSNVYGISKVTERDSGIYVCTGTHQNDDKFEVYSELFVGGKAFHVNIETKLQFLSY